MFIQVLLATCVLAVSWAHDCYMEGAMKDYELKKYLENPRWYVAFVNPEKPAKVFLQEYDCIYLDLKMAGDEVAGMLHGTDRKTQENITLNYRVTEDNAVFTSVAGSFEKAVETLMDTDYDHWALGVSCINLEDENDVVYWVLTRAADGSLGPGAPQELINLRNYPGWRDLSNCTFS